MRGRKPKPTAIKKLAGNPGKRPLNNQEPDPDPTMPDPPSGMTEEARYCWDLLAPELHKIGILTRIDSHALESYCRLYAHARDCWRKAKADGPIVLIAGKPERNPYIVEAHRAEQLLHRLRSELGLNATSRSRMSVKPAEKEEDLDGFLKITQT